MAPNNRYSSASMFMSIPAGDCLIPLLQLCSHCVTAAWTVIENTASNNFFIVAFVSIDMEICLPIRILII
jgi:hypothetical protein